MTIQIKGYGNDQIHLEKSEIICFSQPEIHDHNEYATIHMDEANSQLMNLNEPILPTYIRTITFPIGTVIINVTCIPKGTHLESLSKKIMPTPEPRIAGHCPVDLHNHGMKTDANSYPDTWYQYDLGQGIIGNKRCTILKVQINPVRYFPVQQLLKWIDTVEIKVKYLLSSQPKSNDDIYSFIILTPDAYTNELHDLINHKNSRNISTKLVTLNNIYNGDYFPVQGRDNPEKIKYFIKNAYDSWNTKYVLLVGGSDQFPVRTSHINLDDWDYGDFVSDLYYADIYDENYSYCSWDTNGNDVFGELDIPSITDDMVDLYPDVHLGRLACINADELRTCVNKIIEYETSKAFTNEWFSKIVAVGGDTHVGDIEAIDEGEYINDEIIALMSEFIPDRLYASNGRLSGYVPTGSEKITDAINEGCGFLNFIGHGATWGYGTHPHEDTGTWLPTPDGFYLTDNVLNLLNGEKLPIVFTSGCDVGKFYEDDQCFSWAFISNPNGGGIASCGASAVSYGGGGTNAAETRVGKMIINMYQAYQDGALTFGEMWGTAITNFIEPDMSTIEYKTVESWEAFGDPTLVIAEGSHPPLQPETPSGATGGKIGTEYSYSTNTIDPDGDNIYYLFDWGDDTFSDWIGPYASGEICTANHTWDKKGDFQVRVKARDDHGAQSEWSDSLSITMPKNKVINTHPLILQFFENHPRLSSLLKNLIELELEG